MKILITGIHGFVGSNLVKKIAKGNTLYGLDIVNKAKEGVEKMFSWEDVKENRIPQVDAIIHLAGKAHDTKNSAKKEIYFTINTGLTKTIFDYFCSSSATNFIFFSSVKAAADFVPGDILTEEVPTHPKGPYGESKIKAEEYIQQQLTEKPALKEKSIYILRPCMIHGPGNKGNLNLLYSVVRRGIPWPLGAFENKRSFTSIDNICFVIQELLTRAIPTGIYQMGDDEVLSTNELIRVMCEAMGRRAKIWYLPKGLMRGLAVVGSLLHLPLNEQRLCKLTENYVVSNAKIKKALGIEKMPVSAHDGLIKTIKSFTMK